MPGPVGVPDDDPHQHGQGQEHAQRDEGFDGVVHEMVKHQAAAFASDSGAGWEPLTAPDCMARYLASSRRAVPG